MAGAFADPLVQAFLESGLSLGLPSVLPILSAPYDCRNNFRLLTIGAKPLQSQQ
jgi:hypothetical protein